jgi:heme-degrading monooxygenase HmoA
VYLRIVRLKLREGALWPFREYYENRVLPALAEAEGCLYAALLQPLAGSAEEDCDSLTLWESERHPDAYVASGLYDQLLDGSDSWLASATEWKTDLSRLLPGQRPPLPDPEVETYPVEVGREAHGPAVAPELFLRIVDHRVKPECFEDIRRTYEDSVAPALLATQGCTAAYLLEGLRGKSQALSVTFWNDEESAVRYETSGRFDELAGLLRPYLSGLYQWRLSLAPEGAARTVGGRDLDVSGFHVLIGRRLHSQRD